MLVLSLFFSVLVFNSNTAFSQPFGVTQGSSASSYNSKPTSSKFSFIITPPNPHDEFESYVVRSTPKTGICSITGIGVTLKNDAYGTSAQAAFANITNQLQTKYGNSKEFDHLRSGSIWNEPKEWAMAVYKKERTLSRFWDAEEHSTLSNNVKSIMLDNISLNGSDTYLSVKFEFNNIEECTSIIKSDQSSAF